MKNKINLKGVLVGMMTVGILTSQSVLATTCERSFLGMRPWHAGINKDPNTCAILNPQNDTEMNLMFWQIALNVLADMMVVVGYLAIGFLIYGGFLYMMSNGDSARINKGKSTIVSAIIGVAIAILAQLIVNVISEILIK